MTVHLRWLAAFCLVAHATAHAGTTAFSDVSDAAGIAVAQGGHMPGQAWGDVDGDGWLDLYVTGGTGPNVLYRNDGDGTFSISPFSDQVAMPSSISGGAVFADYDNDGRPDLYVLVESESAGSGPNRLFHNDGASGFTDVTDVAGVGDMGVGTTGSWGDFDEDGDLDLYVANWGCNGCENTSRDGLYRNEGDGTFADISDALGPEAYGFGFVASWLDYDNDGDLDIYLVNDKNFAGSGVYPFRNVLWRNDGPGCGDWCFTDVSVAAGADVAVDGMGLAIADYDDDGDLDMYFSNAGPQVFLRNLTSQGTPGFVDASAALGVGFFATGWGTLFLDYDNDGWRDLYLATSDPLASRANRLFQNDGLAPDPAFTDVTATSGADHAAYTMGVASADYDGDGWMDLVIGNLGGDASEGYVLYRNMMHTTSTNEWLSVRLHGGGPVNRDGVGARVFVTTDDGRTQMSEVKCGSSLGSGNDLAQHFGLGTAAIEEVEVVWPDGLVRSYPGVSANQVVDLSYATVGTPETNGPRAVVTTVMPNPLARSTSIRFDLARAGTAELEIFDAAGRLVRTLIDGPLPAGAHAVIWDSERADGTPAPSGVYLYRLRVGATIETGRFVLAR
jgi:hypothetical protein